jgi:hypothetical protein
MRFGIYIKARGGVVFNSQFEGLSGPSIFATNEPEWPEGPPATHLWIQGCTFSQNNYGYMPEHRAFMVVDPADISIYTRRLRNAEDPSDFRAHLTHGQYANSHVKLIGNVFHDWRGMAVSVRNSRNVQIDRNVFLPPVEDAAMRKTLAADSTLNPEGRGSYAAIQLHNVDGVRVSDNRFHAFMAGDRALVSGETVSGLAKLTNPVTSADPLSPAVALSFNEWFGPMSTETNATGAVMNTVILHSAEHRAGRLGAGLSFAGGRPAELKPAANMGLGPIAQFSFAVWARPGAAADKSQVVIAQGDARNGVVIAIENGRWLGGVWHERESAWLDLGPAITDLWQHIALVFDGTTPVLRGYIGGTEVATTRVGLPSRLDLSGGDTSFGGVVTRIRFGRDGDLAAGAAGYHGMLDEFRFYPRVVGPADLAALALR